MNRRKTAFGGRRARAGKDLAALLDEQFERLPTETAGGEPADSPDLIWEEVQRREVTRAEAGKTSATAPEAIDVPPRAEEVQLRDLRAGENRSLTLLETEQSPNTTHPLGAVIMEKRSPGNPTAPLADVSAEGDYLRDLAALRPVLPSGPGYAPEDVPLPVPPPRTEEEKAAIMARINPERLDALHREIDELYNQVIAEFSSPPENAERALNLLREARQILVERPEDYVGAEYRSLQVQAMFERMRVSRKESRSSGPRIMIYELFWMAAFLAGMVFAVPVTAWVNWLGGITGEMTKTVFSFWNTLMWGGIGGVVGALYHLWWHAAARQDFDRQYFMWYVVQPIMGAILGAIIFLMMAGGLLVLQMDQPVSDAALLLPYVVAVLAGFRQNFVYEQFDRLIALFTPAAQRKENN